MGNNQPSARKKTYYISLAILAGMFFIFGFVSWVNSILCHGHSFGHSIEESRI